MIERNVIAGIPCVIYLPDPFLVGSKLPLITLFRASPDEWFQSSKIIHVGSVMFLRLSKV